MEQNKKYVSREKLLTLPIDIYNQLMEKQWLIDKIQKNLSGDLGVCKHCQRKKVIVCICDEGQADWQKVIDEVQTVQNERNYE